MIRKSFSRNNILYSASSSLIRNTSNYYYSKNSNNDSNGSKCKFYDKGLSLVLLYISSLLVTTNITYNDNVVNNNDNNDKIYRLSEVATHKTKEKGIWVIYDNNVYDITKFVANHPGGQDKIMLAAGKSVEPFWSLYRQHYNSKLPMELLSNMKIGRLHPDDCIKIDNKLDNNDPYSNDPVLSPILHVISQKPINAEAPSNLLSDNWITSTDLWFVRNHHPVPNVDINNYKLTIKGLGINKEISFTLDDLKKKFKKYEVITSIQCGGNRRQEMNGFQVTAGSPWTVSAISTAVWGGVKLRDILKEVSEILNDDNIEKLGIEHVQFQACEDMEASIPIRKAISPYGDVILAYEMNGAPLPAKHGFPLRAIVPGHVGVRNVKWVKNVVISNEEAKGTWQRGMAYKGFGPSTKTLDGIDVEKIPSLQEQPIQSAITVPPANSIIKSGYNLLKGYAYSGGGRGIVRVDISIDGGKNWTTATLKEGSDQPIDRAWAWTLWECEVDIPESIEKTQIICKATDASYNVQPDTVEGIWNLRGINNNAWHRVNVIIDKNNNDDDDDDE